MRISIALVMIAAITATAHAEPELKGTPSELTAYLTDMRRIISIAGESEIKVQADRAYVNLKVESEGRSLQEALSKNATLRQQVMDELKKNGIPEKDISGAKFSSRPEYGIFSDRAKSYKIDNTIRVIVADENQLRVVAAAIDAHEEVVYGGLVFEDSKGPENKRKALSAACDAVTAKKQLYENKFAVALDPLSFTEGQVHRDIPMDLDGYSSLANVKVRGLGEHAPKGITQFGEIIYRAVVTAEYQVITKL